MKKINKIIILLLFVSAICNATNYNHILESNRTWMSNKDANKFLATSYTYYDANPTKNHLLNVFAYLQSRHIVNEQRTKNLAILYKYIRAEKYPVNTYSKNYVPIFIDAKQNNYCAVGHLIKETGYDELAKQINTEHHFDYLINIRTKGVNEWIEQSGFSFEELELIQPGYPPTTSTYEVGSGVNGTIYTSVDNNHQYPIFIGGLFSRAGDKFCSNLAYNTGEDNTDNAWHTLGTGTNGRVNVIKKYGNKLYIGGEFNSINGMICQNLAILDITDMNNIVYDTTFGLDGEVFDIEMYKDTVYVCGLFTGKLSKKLSNRWKDCRMLYNGNPLTMEVYKNILFIGGNMTQPLSVNRFIIKYNGSVFNNISNPLKYPVSSLCNFKNKLYVGLYDDAYGMDTLLYSYDSIGWSVPKYFYNIKLNGYRVSFMENIKDSILSIGGKLNLLYSTSSILQHKGYYQLILNDTQFQFIDSLIYVANTVYTANFVQDKIYMFGDIYKCGSIRNEEDRNNTSFFYNDLKFYDIIGVGVNEVNVDNNNISIYPNPTNNFINIYSEKKIKKYTISDITGNKINFPILNNTIDLIDVSTLTTGMYFIEIETDDGIITKRFIKE